MPNNYSGGVTAAIKKLWSSGLSTPNVEFKLRPHLSELQIVTALGQCLPIQTKNGGQLTVFKAHSWEIAHFPQLSPDMGMLVFTLQVNPPTSLCPAFSASCRTYIQKTSSSWKSMSQIYVTLSTKQHSGKHCLLILIFALCSIASSPYLLRCW